MKSKSSSFRLTAVSLLLACVATSVSCMTTYDSYGRQVQSVDPGLAIAGVAAAGLVGYAASQNRSNYRQRHTTTYHTNYYGGGSSYDDGDHCYQSHNSYDPYY